MAVGEKRKHGTAFQVGPANLPDGTRKRKADRIKQALIDRAKIKQDFEKVKKRKLQEEEKNEAASHRNVYEDMEEREHADGDVVAKAVPHPDRQALMDRNNETAEETEEHDMSSMNRGRKRRLPKQNPYAKQLSFAQKQREESSRRQAERAEAERQRHLKIKDRERMQKMIKKAKRPTHDGKRKLGRESGFLLEKVKKLVNG